MLVNVQRAGPSTGLPTLVGQGDMMQAKWGSHGVYEIIAICPSSPQEMFDLTIQAFNLSEKYRLPVLVMADETVGHMSEKVVIRPVKPEELVERRRPTKPPGKYLPYEPDADLVPPMAIAGQGYRFHVTGLTHDERGYPVMTADAHQKLVRRLADKIRVNRKDIIRYEEVGIEDADVIVCAYGITARVARSAVQMAREQGIRAGMLRLITIWPFAEDRIRELAKRGEGLRGARDQLRPDRAGSRALRRRQEDGARAAHGRRHAPAPGHPGSHQGGGKVTEAVREQRNPIDAYLRVDRLPSIWCAGCGIGTSMGCFIRAIERAKLDADKIALVSGIGCTGRVAGYMRLDSFHTTHGRAIPFATGLALANPELKVVVFSGDGDLAAIGGNHLIHAARRNIDMTVICVNNFNYGMTGGQLGPTTPLDARTATSPYGNFEPPFNLPRLVAASGASFVARWTVYHLRQLERCLAEALVRPGFNFVEVIAHCPTVYGRLNKQGQGVDGLRYFKEKSVIKNGADPAEADIVLDGPIMLGKFVDIQRPSFRSNYDQVCAKAQKSK